MIDKSMKKRIIGLISILAIVTVAHADTIIIEFSGVPSENRIILNWKTGSEDNIEVFFVERSVNNKDYSKIGEVAPKGSNSEYEYFDNNLTNVKNIYYYRLRIRRSDSTSQLSESIFVSFKISSLAKTWGSIKALFQ